jgi:lipoprotein-releasing system ATP-binding protein
MLEAKNVTKVYRTGNVSLPVLHGVSLRVEPGAFLAIAGPSGAGKSTLLHLLAGLDTPTAGEVLWENQPLSRMSERQRATFRNRTVGIVFQFYHLLPELSALENVMLPGLVGGVGSSRVLRERAQRRLEQVGLGGRLHHKPTALSGGEQQRVAIARALVNEPKIIFCDEPTGNLDSKTGEEIAQLLIGLHRQRQLGLVIVTHERSLAELADRTIELRDGRITTESKPSSAAGFRLQASGS